MTEIYLFFDIILPSFILYKFIRGKMAVVEFPVLLAVSFVGWILPQFIDLYLNQTISFEMLDKALLMNGLCLGAAYYGYGKPRHPFLACKIELSLSRLENGVFLIFLMSFLFLVMLARLPKEVFERSQQWQGLPVAYLFFYGNLSVCTIISFFFFCDENNRTSLKTKIVLMGGFFYYIYFIFFQGRRAETIEAVLLVLCVLWFKKRFQPPPLVVASLAMILILFFASIGQYRSVVENLSNGRSWTDVFNIDFFERFKDSFTNGKSYEMENCSILIDSISHEGKYDFGISLYNEMIQNFIPRQIFGEDFKNNLKVDIQSREYEEQDFFNVGYVRVNGSTGGGVTDAFGSFWYFGCFEFFLIGWGMKKLYLGAMKGWLLPGIIYIALLTSAIESITHGPRYILTEMLHDIIFWGPLIWYARRKKKVVVGAGDFSHLARFQK